MTDRRRRTLLMLPMPALDMWGSSVSGIVTPPITNVRITQLLDTRITQSGDRRVTY